LLLFLEKEDPLPPRVSVSRLVGITRADPARAQTARWAALGLIALAICAIHLLLPFRFPVPWPDETSFIAPAFELARHGTLYVWAMNPDRLVMWMPPGYFVFLAALFKVFGYSFGLVRWSSALCVLATAAIVGALVARLTTGWRAIALHAATLVAFASPYMLMSANIGRMEALLALLAMASLLACLRGAPVLGGAIVAASATVHFNAVYFALPYATLFAWLLATRSRLVVQPRELAAVAVAAAILGAYALLVHANLLGFVEDIHFQFQLKRFFGRDDPYHPAWPAVLAAALSAGILAQERRFEAPAILALHGTAFVLLATEGKEIWYDFAPPLGFLLIALAVACGATRRAATVAGLAACLAGMVATGYRQTPFLGPLLPRTAMLGHALLPAPDIARVRAQLAALPRGATVEYAWGGTQPFFLDAMDRAGVRWSVPQHSVTDGRLDRRADWRVQCDSTDVPTYLSRYYPTAPHRGGPSGCDLVRP
jgi:hypothetical protein